MRQEGSTGPCWPDHTRPQQSPCTQMRHSPCTAGRRPTRAYEAVVSVISFVCVSACRWPTSGVISRGGGREAASTPIDLCTTIALLLPLAPPAACSPAVAGEGIRKERPPHPCAAISVNRKGHLSKTLNYLSSSLQLLGK